METIVQDLTKLGGNWWFERRDWCRSQRLFVRA